MIKVMNLFFIPQTPLLPSIQEEAESMLWLSLGLSNIAKTEVFLREKDKPFYIIRGTKCSA